MERAGRVMMSAMLALMLAAGQGGAQQHGMGHSAGGGHGMGMGGGHGMMAMLQGRDTEPHEVAEMRALFMHHPDIRRSVTNLADGIETVTESDDPYLAERIVGHVVGMIGRLDDGRDPRVPIQSATLDILFANRALIRTEMTATETGIRVIQRSDDPATVVALQTHAAEVSDMAARGMQAVHDAMMKR
jgi:hypothetical protein